MKKYVLLFLLFLGLTFQFYLPPLPGLESEKEQSSQSPKKSVNDVIAPFINKDTILIAHANLGMFEFEKLANTLKNQLRLNMKSNQFDTESTKTAEDEFNIILERLIAVARPAVDSFFKQTNLKDIFIVVPDIQHIKYSCAIIPLSDKNKQQIRTLEEFIKQGNCPNIKFQDDYILIPFDHDIITDSEMPMTDFYSKTFKPGKNPKLEKFFLDHSDETLCAVLSSFDLVQLIKETQGEDLFEEAKKAPINITPFMMIVKEAFDNAVLTFNLNTLDITLKTEFIDQESAGKLKKELTAIRKEAISLWIKTYSDKLEKDEPSNLAMLKAFNVFPFVQAYANGLFNTLLPKQDKNTLVFSAQKNGNQNIAAVPVIGMLVGILLPAVQSSRNAARRMSCTNNLKNIGVGILTFHDAQGKLPPVCKTDANGKPLHSWRVLILPFIEQSDLYNSIRLNEPWDSEWNSQFHSQMPSVYGCPNCPEDTKKGLTHYSVITGKETPFTGSEGEVLASIKDGTSNTIMVIERNKKVCWMDPNHELTYKELEESNFKYPCSIHDKGGNVLYCDISVRFISEIMSDPEVFKNAVHKDDGK